MQIYNQVMNRVKVLPFYLLLLLASFSSCSEESGTVEEYPNWPATNDAYFSKLVAEAQVKKAAGDTSWDVIPTFTKPSNYSYSYSDHIVVEKLENGSGTVSPILSDTVQVHYVGKLIPSADKYKVNGYQFDASYAGTFDAAIATPVNLAVGGTVVGFATALMNMRDGDHWKVYIPYQLGYGAAAQGSIPAGSTLIFDLRLVKHWRKK